MKLDFKFSNLFGTVYKQGNIIFTPDGNSILSPVGNRVSMFDLVGNKSVTFPFENAKNISRIALSPNGSILITVDEDGRALLVNFSRQTVLHHFNFKAPVLDLQFSPDGKFIAAAHQSHIQVWRAPGFNREFAPFVKHRTYTGHHNDVTSISWSKDSKFFISTSKDLTVRIYSLDPILGFKPFTLAGHRSTVLGAWFSDDSKSIFSVSADGTLVNWRFRAIGLTLDNDQDDEDEQLSIEDYDLPIGEAAIITGKASSKLDLNGIHMNISKKVKPNSNLKSNELQNNQEKRRWTCVSRHYFNQNHAKVTSVAFHQVANLLVVGFSSGVFGIWELPNFTCIHTLSISQKKITTVNINPTGEWLVFGSSKLGQLLVWEWQSETYILKQQGHHHDMSCVSYSPDGQHLVTGGDDGKVKVWSALSGFCFVTFMDHSAGISAAEFAKAGQVVFSASLDGTVRAYDLVRYRNFRTFTSPSPVQFGCLAVDPSGEVVAAGSIDSFEIFVWSVQTGKLLDILSGHEGPISSLAFSPTEGLLASGSWDHTVRTWDVFGRGGASEAFEHTSDVLAISFRPDGKVIASSTLDGDISFWEIATAKLLGSIEGRKDISGGRKMFDRTTAANSSSGKSFNSICFTADGNCILAGGNSKYVCIYDTRDKVLLKKFTLTKNLSLDGTQEFLNSKNMTDAGPLNLIDETGELSDLEDRIEANSALPGVRKGDQSLRKNRPEARTRGVRYSPTGQSWAAASTEGLLIYSLEQHFSFDPFDLDIDITPEAVKEATKTGDHLRALVTAFRLGEKSILHTAFQSIPSQDIPFISKDLPIKYLDRALKLLVSLTEESPRLEFLLIWITSILKSHSEWLKTHPGEFAPILRALQKNISGIKDDLSKICDENSFSLQYLIEKSSRHTLQQQNQTPSIEI